MKKIEKEYHEEYDKISRNDTMRFSELLRSMKLSDKSRKEIFPYIQRNLDIEWDSIAFIIYLVPKATPRPRHNIARNIFYVSGAKDNKDIFEKFVRKLDINMITTPCKFYCNSYLPIPKSMSNVEKILAELGLIRPISKPDFDNLSKTYSDMLTGTLIYDDMLIIEGVSKKFYSTLPRIEIRIAYMKQHDCLYNEKKMRKKVE